MKAIKLIIFFLVWLSSLWISYWLGFGRSVVIAAHVQKMGYRTDVLEQKMLLSKIKNGDIQGVGEYLSERMAINDQFLGLPDVSVNSSMADDVYAAIYPRGILI